MNSSSSVITAADVAAFMQQQAATLAAATGQDYIVAYIEAGNPNYPHSPLEVQWKVYVPGPGHIMGKDLEMVMQKAIAVSAPAEVAKAKREAAAKLLAEADALCVPANQSST